MIVDTLWWVAGLFLVSVLWGGLVAFHLHEMEDTATWIKVVLLVILLGGWLLIAGYFLYLDLRWYF